MTDAVDPQDAPEVDVVVSDDELAAAAGGQGGTVTIVPDHTFVYTPTQSAR